MLKRGLVVCFLSIGLAWLICLICCGAGDDDEAFDPNDEVIMHTNEVTHLPIASPCGSVKHTRDDW